MAIKMLTEIGVERLKPSADGKRLEIWDTILQGLCLRVSEKGVKSWYLIYRMNGGKQRRMLLGHYPIISLKQARNLAREGKFEISQGNDPLMMREQKRKERERIERETITVAQLGEQCVERHWKPNISRWKGMQGVFIHHINPVLGDMSAKDVMKKDVHRLLDKQKNSKNPHTANHCLVALRKAYNWGIERDILTHNPCHAVKKPVPSRSRERFLNDAEIKELWRVCDEEINYPYGPVIKLLLLTGQRCSEIAQLKWHEIDFDAKLIRLSGEKVKNKKSHEVPLSDLALDIFKSVHRHRGAYIFSSTAGRKAINGFGKTKERFDRYFKPKESWRFHDLRRTAATHMAILGVSREQIKQILNHSDGSVTAVYDRHSYLPEKRKALDLWARHIESIVSGTKDDNVVPIRGKNE